MTLNQQLQQIASDECAANTDTDQAGLDAPAGVYAELAHCLGDEMGLSDDVMR